MLRIFVSSNNFTYCFKSIICYAVGKNNIAFDNSYNFYPDNNLTFTQYVLDHLNLTIRINIQ